MPLRLHDLDRAEMAVLDAVTKVRKTNKGGPSTKVTTHPDYVSARGRWEAVAEEMYKGGSALERARQKIGEAISAVIKNVDQGRI